MKNLIFVVVGYLNSAIFNKISVLIMFLMVMWWPWLKSAKL